MATKPPSRRVLYRLVWTRPVASVARELGMSGAGLAKLCGRLGVPVPARGHWARVRAGRAEPPPPLPSATRHVRTRRPAEERQANLLDAAATLIANGGLAAASLRAAARQAGLSEAQARNYFASAGDLLAALARRELAAMEAARRTAIAAADEPRARVQASTRAYLAEAAARGPLLERLMSSAAVRSGLARERGAARRSEGGRVARGLADRYGLPLDVAAAMTSILTAVTLRAGRLLARRRLSLEAAERLSMAIVAAGNRAVIRRYGSRPAR
jgi:AcrR family transcriptional regulator